eukprot:UC4_evm10s179
MILQGLGVQSASRAGAWCYKGGLEIGGPIVLARHQRREYTLNLIGPVCRGIDCAALKDVDEGNTWMDIIREYVIKISGLGGPMLEAKSHDTVGIYGRRWEPRFRTAIKWIVNKHGENRGGGRGAPSETNSLRHRSGKEDWMLR